MLVSQLTLCERKQSAWMMRLQSQCRLRLDAGVTVSKIRDDDPPRCHASHEKRNRKDYASLQRYHGAGTSSTRVTNHIRSRQIMLREK
ncbi:hypothetical protein GCM10009105_07570 [Dokdonella soli]|uniref:Uncharacterized protein n=1 Tax=Dokdonella soli TaxID=529810 RepID=A0ABP3TJ67_9GAMM